MKYVIVPVNEAEPVHTVEATTETSYDILHNAVGGWFEKVDFPATHPFAGHSMFMNEEGIAMRLPLNVRADAAMRGTLFRGDYIKGTAVIVGGVDDNSESTSVQQVVLDYFDLT